MRYLFLIVFISLLSLMQAQGLDPYVQAVVKAWMGQTDSALIYIDSAIALKPGQATLHVMRGDLYYNKGILQKALMDYQQADRLEEGTGFYGQAKYYTAIGNTAKSMEFLKKHLESKYKLPQKTIRMDQAFASVENTREWNTLWQQEWYSKLDYLLSDAALMIASKEYMDAVNLLSRYLREHEKRHEAYALRGQAYYEMNSFKNALSDMNTAIGISKRNAAYFKLRARTEVQLNQFNEAVADYSEALDIKPSDVEIYSLRAEALRLAGRFDESLSDITTYMSYMGGEEKALYIAAKTMYEKGDYLKALSYVNRIIEKNQGNPDYYLFRGNAYYHSNMAKYAVKDYGMALDLNSNLLEAWVNKGKARLAAGDKNGACHDWQIAAQKGSIEAVQFLQDKCLK